jgi:hypothetical protein
MRHAIHGLMDPPARSPWATSSSPAVTGRSTKMRIEVVGGGHMFQGTPKQILMQMKSLVPGAAHMTMREYIEGNFANIARTFNIQFKLQGETEEELAESFLTQMIEGGYAKKL